MSLYTKDGPVNYRRIRNKCHFACVTTSTFPSLFRRHQDFCANGQSTTVPRAEDKRRGEGQDQWQARVQDKWQARVRDQWQARAQDKWQAQVRGQWQARVQDKWQARVRD